MNSRSADAVPPGYVLSLRSTKLAIAGLLLSVLLAGLNQTIVSTAGPSVVSDLGGVHAYSWVFTAYILSATVAGPICGALSDVYGRRRLMLVGLGAFMTGGVLCSAATSMTELIFGRAVQGVGAGVIIPVVFAGIADLTPPSERARWQGLLGVAFAAASILGPLTGGVLADHADWRFAFLASLPVGAGAALVVAVYLKIPLHPARTRSVDYVGAVLFASGLTAFLLGIAQLGNGGRIGQIDVAVPVLSAFCLLALLALNERRVPEPLIPLELLKNREFRSIALASLNVGAAMFGLLFFVPLFAQSVLGATATASGALLTPLMLAMSLTSLASGQLVYRTGRYRWALTLGPLLMAAGCARLATVGQASSTAEVAVPVVIAGLGLGLLVQNLVLAAQVVTPPQLLGVATGCIQFCRQTGGTLGLTVMGAVLAGAVPTSESGAGASAAQRAAMADAFHTVFLIGLPALGLAFLLLRALTEVPLRTPVPEGADRIGPDGIGQDSAHRAASTLP